MHVSGGLGNKYRAAFRRDWPTHQAYPNLWPYRVVIQEWDLFNFPAFPFDNMVGTYSEPAEMSSDGQRITYTWRQSILLATYEMLMTHRVGVLSTDSVWSWLFTSNVKAGFLLMTYHGYLLRPLEDVWQTNGPLTPGSFTFEGVGDFGACDYVGAEPYMRMNSLRWVDAPDEDREP